MNSSLLPYIVPALPRGARATLPAMCFREYSSHSSKPMKPELSASIAWKSFNRAARRSSTVLYVCLCVGASPNLRTSLAASSTIMSNSSAATGDKSSPEFEQLYQFLLECFTAADNDYDGKVDAEEFDMMVELAAKDVRRLGLAPTHKQTYRNGTERRAARTQLFDQINADRSGYISFEEWLEYALRHIAGKVATAPVGDSSNMKSGKQEFLRFISALSLSRESAEFKEFYAFLLDCFRDADQDRDGKVLFSEFDSMVEKAGAMPRMYGLAPLTTDMFATTEARVTARRRPFESMDAAGQGFISFDQWLEFTYEHVCQKAAELQAKAYPSSDDCDRVISTGRGVTRESLGGPMG